MGRWSSKGAGEEVVIKVMVGGGHQKGAGGEVVIKRELVGM